MSLICRTCLENVEKTCYFYIDTFDNSGISNTIPKDVLQLCVPELDLYISEQPGICTECLNMFETFYKFKNRCIASEEKILTYIKKNRIDANCKISLKSVLLDEPSTPQSEESEGPQEAIPSTNGSDDETKLISDTTLWVARFVKDHPILINKSQSPAVKTKKESALNTLKKTFEEQFGKPVTLKQLMKKINNMKTSVRVKIDKKQTGYKEIKLSVAEHIMYDIMMDSNTENPSLDGATKAEREKPATASPSTSCRVTQPTLPPPPPPCKKPKILESAETEETRKLSNTELQRLVLLEQLAYIRLKRQRLQDTTM